MPNSQKLKCQTCLWYQKEKKECWLEPPRLLPVDPSNLEVPRKWGRTPVEDPTQYCSHQEDKK